MLTFHTLSRIHTPSLHLAANAFPDDQTYVVVAENAEMLLANSLTMQRYINQVIFPEAASHLFNPKEI